MYIAEDVFDKYLILIEPKKHDHEPKKASKIESEKPLVQPFSYDYYSPVVGDVISSFAENRNFQQRGYGTSRAKKVFKPKKSEIKEEDNDAKAERYKEAIKNLDNYKREPEFDLFTISSHNEIKK